MMLLLISPQPECVFIFFVSFIQSVQDPNKLYFLNLPLSVLCLLLNHLREELAGGGEAVGAGETAAPHPSNYCILTPCSLPGLPPLRRLCTSRFWQKLLVPMTGPCPSALLVFHQAPPLQSKATPALQQAWPQGVQKEGVPPRSQAGMF